jgi:HK97 family phage prohead protease
MKNGEIERRTLSADVSEAEIEFRGAENGEKRPVITGYASVFGLESRNLGGFVETVHPRAFDDVLAAGPDVLGLFNHDKNKLLARSGNGSLKLSVDSRGLRYEMSLPATRDAEDVATMVKERLVTGSSFAFAVRRNGGDSWTTDERGMKHREIRSVALLEDVGPVVRPAYDDSSVVVSRRAIEMALGESYRPNQTMSNAARRGLRVAEKRDDIDQRLIVISERVANREIISIEEVSHLGEIQARCLAAKAANWNGTTPHVEWLLAGGDSGQKWVERRSELSSQNDSGSGSVTPPPAEPTKEPETPPAAPSGGPEGAVYVEIGPESQRSATDVAAEHGACKVVQGSISEDGTLKLWVTPEEQMSDTNQRSEGAAVEEPPAASNEAPPSDPPATEQAPETPPSDLIADETLAANIKLAELNAALLRTRLQSSSAAQ